MSEKTRKTGFYASALGLIALLVIGLLAGSSSKTPAESTTNKGGKGGAVCDQQAVVRSVLTSAGFTSKQYTVGDKFNLSLPAAVEAGHGKFASKPLTTKAALIAFLKSSQPAAQKVMATTVKQSGGTRQQAFNPSNWVGFQLLVPSDWEGNTFFVDGKVKPAGTRHSAVGDIGWMFINPIDCASKANVVRVVIIRLGCGNPQTTVPKPRQPKPAPKPTCPPGQVMLPQGVCSQGKDAGDKPVPAGGPVIQCPGGYYGRDGKCHTGTYTPSPQPTPSQGAGQGDSGPGATNTTPPPPTTAPEDPNPSPSSPTSNPPKP